MIELDHEVTNRSVQKILSLADTAQQAMNEALKLSLIHI